MHRLSILVLTSLLLAPGLARADIAPDVDKYMACEGLAVDATCEVSSSRDFYNGTCQNLPCDGDPEKTCLTCVEEDPQGTAGEVGTAGEEGTAGGSSGGSTAGEGTAGGTAGEGGATSAPTTGGSTGAATGTATGSAGEGSTTDTGTGDSKGGCSCRDADAPAGGLLILVGAALLRRRRR